MAGTSQGSALTHFVGLRVSLPCIYHKPELVGGQTTQARLRIKAFMNDSRGKSYPFDLTAFGKYADVCAKSLSIGKEFHCHATPKPYEANVWCDKVQVMKADGTPLKITRTGYVIEKITFGAESEKFIATQIAAAHRPANWNDGGQGSKDWSGMLKALHASAYDGVTPTYGYAKVYQPNAAVAAPVPNVPAVQAGMAAAAGVGPVNPFK